MTHIKESLQSPVGYHRLEEEAIKSIHIHKDIPPLADHTIDNSRQNEGHGSRDFMYFMICRNCFWCASFLSTHRTAENCPTCSLDVLEAIPLASNEKFKVSLDQQRGVMFEFSTRSK